MAKVSIIIPVYNTEKYIDECINSVINQTYKDIEVILINDGSTDSSLSICKKYEKLDKRIKVINKKHSGVSSARNEGIKKITGKYVMFLDSDDYYNLDYVEKMYNALVKNKCDMVISGFKLCYKKSTSVLQYSNCDIMIDFNSIIYDIVNTPYFNSMSKTIIKKDIIEKNKIKFDTKLNYFEDYIVSFDAMKCSKKIMYLSNCLYNYRVNSDSTTQNMDIDKALKWYHDGLYALNYINSSIAIDNINSLMFDRICFAFRILAKMKNTKYKVFKKEADRLLDELYTSIPRESIDINKIHYSRKIYKFRAKMIYKNHLKLFYYITRFEKFILNIIR